MSCILSDVMENSGPMHPEYQNGTKNNDYWNKAFSDIVRTDEETWEEIPLYFGKWFVCSIGKSGSSV